MKPREYVITDEATVPQRTLQAARDALSFAAIDLELSPDLRIVWFMPRMANTADLWAGLGGPSAPERPGAFEVDAALLGATLAHDDHAIWVRGNLSPQRTAEIVLHECAHVFQRGLAGPPRGTLETDGREEQARRYQLDLAEIAASIAGTGKGNEP